MVRGEDLRDQPERHLPGQLCPGQQDAPHQILHGRLLTWPHVPVSPGPQSPGRPVHSPCPRSPLSPFTPTSLSPKPEHSPLKPSSPVPYGSPASQSRSPTQTPVFKETANRWPHSTSKTASPTNQNSHWAGTHSTARAVSPPTQSSAPVHRAGATTANTPRYTDPSQVCSHCLPEKVTACPHPWCYCLC